MVGLLTDVMLLEAGNGVQYNFGNMPESVWSRDYAGVCKKYGVDTADFRKSMDWYGDHPEKFATTMEQVITQLRRLEVDPNKKQR